MLLVWAIKQKFNDLSEGDKKKKKPDDSAKAFQPPLERANSVPLVIASGQYPKPVVQLY